MLSVIFHAPARRTGKTADTHDGQMHGAGVRIVQQLLNPAAKGGNSALKNTPPEHHERGNIPSRIPGISGF